jgi:cleavage stimulation factor subunit 2
MIVHKESGRPRGFCFVELEDDDAAANAVSALNDTDFGGRRLKVEFRHRDAEAGRAQPRTNSQA